jgi:hypothetical protein
VGFQPGSQELSKLHHFASFVVRLKSLMSRPFGCFGLDELVILLPGPNVSPVMSPTIFWGIRIFLCLKVIFLFPSSGVYKDLQVLYLLNHSPSLFALLCFPDRVPCFCPLYPPVPASQVAEITSVYHHTQPFLSKSLITK